MRKVRLGKTGLMVSEVGFGGIPIQRLTDDDAVALVRRCLDLGVTFIDTAYGYGTSEERIGRAIQGRREGLILASKSPARDAATFSQHLDQSLRRLGVDHIELYQFHNVSTQEQFDQVVGPGGALQAAREAQAAGKIGHIGVTSHSREAAVMMAGSGLFETMMFPFNFVTSEPLERLIPICRQNDVGFIAMKPMAGGMLENATIAFKWLRQYPDLVPIPGIEAPEEMEEIVALMQGPAALSDAERAEMQRLMDELGTEFCRRCDYCQPCPQNIRISTLMNMKSFLKRFPPERFFAMMGEVVAQAEECQDCGECEARCPYHLAIRAVMRENMALYAERRAQYRPA